jgi:hypothetical protein
LKLKYSLDVLSCGERKRLCNIWQDNDFSLYCKIAIAPRSDTADFAAPSHDSADWSYRTETERKLSYHTSGRVNYHALLPSSPRYFQPLCDIDLPNPVFALSITDFSRLERATTTANTMTVDLGNRTAVALGFTVMPSGTRGPPVNGGVWCRIDYEHFGFAIHEMPSDFIPASSDVHAYAPPSMFAGQPMGKREAELAYVQKGREGELTITGPDGTGAYTLFPSVIMARTPSVSIRFKKDRHIVEQDGRSQPHKVVFRINGPGGRVRQSDLRDLIETVVMNARLLIPNRE